MNIFEKVSDAELEVLRVLWESEKAMSSAEINDALKKSMGWEKSTIRTLVHRLIQKGALQQEKKEMFYYLPVFTEKEYVTEQTKNFLAKMYKGNAKNLVASLFEQDCIQPDAIDELKRFWKEGEV